MTDAEINRKVAEAAGYELDPTSGPGFIRAIVRRSEGDGWETSYSWAFNPRHDANQAIEALDRVFYQWIIYTTDAPLYPDQKITVKGKMAGEWYTGQGETTCHAACNAILATLAPHPARSPATPPTRWWTSHSRDKENRDVSSIRS